MNCSLEILTKTALMGLTFYCRTIKQNGQRYLIRGYDKSVQFNA